MYYVYRWYNIKTNYTFYIGKGCRNRYKSVRKRNKLFLNYYNANECGVEILEHFDDEFEALTREKELIASFKSEGQCSCNISEGGYGGLNFVWTPEMRKYKSEYNPMKSEKQRNRMHENNPMKNPETAQKVAEKTRKHPIIDGVEYNSVQEASRILHVHIGTIWNWCRRGYNTDFKVCYYKGESPTPFKVKHRNSRPIIVGDLFFSSVKEAAEHFDSYPEKFIRAIKNNKTVFGLTCKYANQQPSTNLNDL